MSYQDQVRTSSDCLWGSMGLDQKLQLLELMRSQLKRTLGTMMMHGVPRLPSETITPTSHALSRTVLLLCLFLGKASRSHFLSTRGRYEFLARSTNGRLLSTGQMTLLIADSVVSVGAF